MGFWVHAIGSEAETGMEYGDKAAALAARSDGQTVTYLATADEQATWYEREYQRFIDREYARPPWYEYLAERDYHYVHLSIKHIGYVAYTPNDEYGIADRQLRVRPGRYLEQFYPNLEKAQRDAYCAQVKAFDGKVQLATSAADIVRVYVNGPNSCMSGHGDEYPVCGGHHPCEVYGDSDLAVAYYGPIGKPTARCVVWPERKIATRIYGDATLGCILQSDGYTFGHLGGATIRRIAIGNGDSWLMPYIDGAAGVTKVNVRTWRLVTADGPYDYGVKDTEGYIGETISDDEQPTCEYCEQRDCHDTDCCSYCARCCDRRWTCTDCNGESFDPDDVNAFEFADGQYCDDCAREHQRTCTVCDETYAELNYHPAVRRTRQLNHDAADRVCDSCAETHTRCVYCETWYADDANDGACPDADCAARLATDNAVALGVIAAQIFGIESEGR